MQIFNIKADVEIVHLLAELAQGVVTIAHGVFVIDGRQYVGERRIVFNMLFELRQHRHQLRHFLRALCRCKQKQNGVQVAFLRHDAVFTQVVGKNGRRDAKVGVLPGLRIDTGRG